MKFLIILLLISCTDLKKDNIIVDPVESQVSIKAMRLVYQEEVRANADSYGLWISNNKSVGDSAVFSCLARVGGALDFNPNILLSEDGQLGRHASLWDDRDGWINRNCTFPPAKGKSSCTPVSKDMMNGFLWCLVDYGEENKVESLKVVKNLISFGKDHDYSIGSTGWLMCTKQDKEDMNITAKDWLSRCLMLPSIVKDIYRVAKWLGYNCNSDLDCKAYMALGVNLPTHHKGYQRHLSNNTQVRNGIVEGALNNNSLKLLKKYSEEESNNPIYLASYHLFYDGDQSEAFSKLLSYPKDRIPSESDYCSDWHLQRDETRDEVFSGDLQGCIVYNDKNTKEEVKECGLSHGQEYHRVVYNRDWLPCGGGENGSLGFGADWLFAAALALGDLPNVEGLKLNGNFE